jgi:hypothetical protein
VGYDGSIARSQRLDTTKGLAVDPNIYNREQISSDDLSTYVQGLYYGWVATNFQNDDAQSELDDFTSAAALLGHSGVEHAELPWVFGQFSDYVRSDYWLEYVRDLIDETYTIPRGDRWPYSHITVDYSAAADELESDFTEVRFGGHTWLVRG